ncbi:MAG: right-handed parallel beta-helix repeat-containing protein [Methylobacter sp.]|uniref:right-handed parallel beta-helix repeat-containing protein n=1 Tax=Methylobacter sp. TaxID=2051955 RepID=UPI0025F80E48|nr:right-handed parallel beta-helix repeat-containing protein [Methylobacter sp.]MCK9620230.1 right-handed parallel beta-helix repeat-containing protein [Methylobacter sp.]
MKKKISSKLFFIVCIQGLFGLQQAYAATYYVAPAGSDTNNGTSLSAPVKTIRQALSKARSSGDIVYVRAGTYVEAVSISQSGITLSAYQAEKPIIDGQSSLPSGDWGSLVSISGNNNKVSGFEVKNSNIKGARAGGYGVWLGGHHNTVSKMNVHHTWENGILAQGDYSTIEDSSVWQAARRNANGSGGGMWSGGLNAARNRNASALKPGITSYATIRRNKVYNNWGEGLSCYEVDHCTIEDNIVYDNWTVNMYLSDATNSVVQRNMVYASSAPAITTRNSGRPGIAMFDEVASRPRSSGNTLINNFLRGVDFSAFTWTGVTNSGLRNTLIANNTIVDGRLNVGGSSSVIHSNSQIRNNILAGGGSVATKSGLTFSHNNWATTPPSAAAASTNVVRDPQVSRSGSTSPGALTPAYFKVSGSSPAINAAMALTSVSNDYFKASRGSAPDIGGHEYGSTTTTTSPTTTTPTTTTEPTTTSTPTTTTQPTSTSVNISSKYATNITRNSATIKWTTNVPTSGTVWYTVKSDVAAAGTYTLKVVDSNLSTSHSVNLGNLYNNTTYYYKITATNGSSTTSTTSTFKSSLN